MPEVPDEVQATIEAELKPTLTEITRAKNAILQLLAASRQPENIGTLQSVLVEAERLPPPSEAAGSVDVEAAGVETIRSLPVVKSSRLARAGAEAVIDLEAQGIIVGVESLPGESPLPILREAVRIPATRRNHGFAVTVPTLLPSFLTAYRLAPRYSDLELPWYLDADIFLLDLEELSLEPRTRRALVEALQAFRHRLYLAAANLLGAVSEGAWYSVAVRLSPYSSDLAGALTNDRPSALTIRRKAADALRRDGRLRGEVDGLVAQAETLRLMRNYAVHPKDLETEHLERYLGEAATGVLILNSHSYLTRLMTVTEEWLAGPRAAES